MVLLKNTFKGNHPMFFEVLHSRDYMFMFHMVAYLHGIICAYT